MLVLIASRVTPAVFAWSSRAAALASSLDDGLEPGRDRADRILRDASRPRLVNSCCLSCFPSLDGGIELGLARADRISRDASRPRLID